MKTLSNLLVVAVLALSGAAQAQKVYLNPSNQTGNPVAGGGNEAQYALINANLASKKLTAAGFVTRVDQDFYNAPANANSWGANIFVSIHSNAGGGHGIETLYKSSGGKVLASKVQTGLATNMPYEQRPTPLVYRDNLHVLNNTNMYATLTEVLYHDCALSSGRQGHPPAESAFLKTAAGQEKISTGISKGVCSYYNKSCTPVVAKGWIRGVVYKGTNLSAHLAGATVKLNTGASVVYDGGAGWAFEVAPGTYTLTASASGYVTGSKVVTVTAGGTSWASIGLNPVPVVQKGWLRGVVYKSPNLSDRLAGATVKLNTGATATYNGTTEWAFELPVGTYTVTASAAGYVTASVSATVTAGGTTWSNVGLNPVKGWIKGAVVQAANPAARIAGATVKLSNGLSASYDGVNPFAFQVNPGTYTVTASAPGFVTASATAVVLAGQTATTDVKLVAVPKTGWIKGVVFKDPDIASHIAGAQVKLSNGQTATFNGTDLWSFEVPVGTYTVTASAFGYAPASNTVTVTASATTWSSIGLKALARGSIKGVVYKSPDIARHIAGATVKLNTGASVVYNGTDLWSFDVPVGTYTVTASAAGYAAKSATVTVTANTITWSSMGLSLQTSTQSPLDPLGEAPATLDSTPVEADAAGGCSMAGGAPLPLPMALLVMGLLRRRSRNLGGRT